MKNKQNSLLVLVLSFTMIFSTVSFSQIKLLSGLKRGTYNRFAMDIKSISSQDIKVLPSGGSVENLKLLIEDNDINITFLQYDVLLKEFEKNPELKKNIRVFLPIIHLEEIHLITKKDSDIEIIDDLAGKNIGVGNANQGTRVTASVLKDEIDVEWNDVEIESNNAISALMKGEIDAFFYVGGAPIKLLNDLEKETTDKIKLVSIKSKYTPAAYINQKIKSSSYSWLNQDIYTFSVITVLVVKIHQNEVNSELEKLYSDIDDNVDKLQKDGHPKWKDVYDNYRKAEIDWPFYTIEKK